MSLLPALRESFRRLAPGTKVMIGATGLGVGLLGPQAPAAVGATFTAIGAAQLAADIHALRKHSHREAASDTLESAGRSAAYPGRLEGWEAQAAERVRTEMSGLSPSEAADYARGYADIQDGRLDAHETQPSQAFFDGAETATDFMYETEGQARLDAGREAIETISAAPEQASVEVQADPEPESPVASADDGASADVAVESDPLLAPADADAALPEPETSASTRDPALSDHEPETAPEVAESAATPEPEVAAPEPAPQVSGATPEPESTAPESANVGPGHGATPEPETAEPEGAAPEAAPQVLAATPEPEGAEPVAGPVAESAAQPAPETAEPEPANAGPGHGARPESEIAEPTPAPQAPEPEPGGTAERARDPEPLAPPLEPDDPGIG